MSWHTTGTQNTTGSRLAARSLLILKKAAVGIEPTNKGFADLCLTTWLRRRVERGREKSEGRKLGFNFLLSPFAFFFLEAGDGI